MMKIYPAFAVLTAGFALCGAASAADFSEYRVRDLLQPCMEGDNDSRGGAVLELECEQYITGFTDSYVLLADTAKDKVCLPKQNRADEVRWAFMRWAHENFEKRDLPAVQGLMATVKSVFKCK